MTDHEETNEIPVDQVETFPDGIPEQIEDTVLPNRRKLSRFYDRLRRRVISFAEKKNKERVTQYLLLLPDLFILMLRLIADKRVSVRGKLLLAGAITYLVIPLDIIPDFLPVMGSVDDLLVAAMAVNRLMKGAEAKIIQQHWSGSEDLLELIGRMITTAEKYLGTRIIGKVKNFFKTGKMS